MMRNEKKNTNQSILDCSIIFSRSSFEKMMKYDDFSILDNVLQSGELHFRNHEGMTYYEVLSRAYKFLVKNYRNEYVYKNTLISTILNQYGSRNTVMFNEFPVGNSIADFVLFNGCSKVFEIKTELDSEKRLATQLNNYMRLFQYCYLVVHESQIDKYAVLNQDMGLIEMSVNRGVARLNQVREAKENRRIDPYILISSLRTDEYKRLVARYYKEMPEMTDFNSFDVCFNAISQIPSDTLNRLFITLMKERKNNSCLLQSFNKYIRQICLSLHFSEKEYAQLNNKLLMPINL